MRSGIFLLLLCLSTFANADMSDFHPGELIPEYGLIAEVPGVAPLPENTRMKLAIDVVEGGEAGVINGKFTTAASFLNLHHANGIDPDNIEIALVVHGPAHRDILNSAAYAAEDGGENPNAGILAALQEYQVKVYYCGQSAVYRGVEAEDLLPGVEITHSATTTHVLLQQQGFSIRP